MKHLLISVVALGMLSTAAERAFSCDVVVTPHVLPQPTDSALPDQPCANDGDCPAGKSCVNFRQIWDGSAQRYIWTGECSYETKPTLPDQPCANDGDCPAGKSCVNFRQVWDGSAQRYVWTGECSYGPQTPPLKSCGPDAPAIDSYRPYQLCAFDGDCPAGKSCMDMRLLWNEATRQCESRGECLYPT